jgi:hypothetical protein
MHYEEWNFQTATVITQVYTMNDGPCTNSTGTPTPPQTGCNSSYAGQQTQDGQLCDCWMVRRVRHDPRKAG